MLSLVEVLLINSKLKLYGENTEGAGESIKSPEVAKIDISITPGPVYQ